MKKLLGAIVVAAGFVLGGCSGNLAGMNATPSGGPGAVSPQAASTTSTAAGTGLPAPGTVAISSKDHRHLVRLVVHFKVPKRTHRKGVHAKYISPSSQSITITLNTVNGGNPPAGLLTSTTTNLVFSGGGKNCDTSGCTVFGPSVPPGSDNLSLSLFDGQNGAGNVLSAAQQTFTVTPGQSNSLSVTLAGVASTFAVGTLPSGTAGTAFSSAQAFTVGVLDHGGNTITGTYSAPVTVSDDDASGATLLSVNGGTASTSVQLTKDTDVLKLNYTGLAIAAATLSVSATGATTATGSFAPVLSAPTYTCNGGGSGDTSECDATPKQLDLYTASGTGSHASFVSAQTGWTGAPFGKTFSESDTCGASGANIATIGTSDHLTFTATAVASPVVGNCTITLTGGGAKTLAITLTYTTSGIGINARHRRQPLSP